MSDPVSVSGLQQTLLTYLKQSASISYAQLDADLRIEQVAANWFEIFPADSTVTEPGQTVIGAHIGTIFYQFAADPHPLNAILTGESESYRLENVQRATAYTDTIDQRFYTIEFRPSDPTCVSAGLFVIIVDTTSGALAEYRLIQERNELADAISNKEQAELALNKAQRELEQRVRDRTLELKRTNEELVREIQERQQIEAELLHSQKMEAIGRLAGGIAHDFNNLLTVIISYSDLLLSNQADNESVTTFLGPIKGAGQQASALTKQLLAFSRKQIVQPEILNINDAVIDIEKMMRRLIGVNMFISINLREDLWFIKMAASQLNQILINLVVNARDAMPDGGEISIGTRNVYAGELGPALERQYPTLAPGCIELVVSDTGVGMDDETRGRIFEPFFTTKEKGKGTGLGLSTVYGIVTHNEGFIQVESEKGKGTTFRLYLPRTRVMNGRMGTGPLAHTEPAGGETILVVEDDPIVRDLLLACLDDKGYDVHIVSSGQDALNLLSKNTDISVDLLLTDVMLQGMNGRELATQITAEYPAVKVLYMSGYHETMTFANGILHDEMPLLEKPFTLDTLSRRVYNTLHDID